MADKNTGTTATSDGPEAGKAGTTTTEKPAAGSTPAADAGKTGDTGTTAAAGTTGAAETPKAGEKPAAGTTGTAGDTGGTADEGTTTESKAPAKYDLKIPAAGVAYVSDGDIQFLEKQARAYGWSNEDAQAALDEHVDRVKAQSEQWLTDLKADKIYGGEQLETTQTLAKRVIDRVRPAGHDRREGFLRFLNSGGAGNHIEVVSFLADLGKMMGEDSPAASRSASGRTSGDVASRLYDHPDSVAADKASRG